MAKRNSRNNDLLKETKNTTTPKVYSLLVSLVNEDKENLAEDVLKIDYLLTYTNNCIKDKDFKEAKYTLQILDRRIENLKKQSVDIDHLSNLYDKLNSQIKK
ncbi:MULTISPECIES: hypothetical protein [Clostridium]|uniref:Uncharacterized protein n=2 Tax=Clostridium TaxID=1485 RepID=B2TI39_CLOBB|nr:MULTISPECIES: hypothetical protein [Clostridium]ACD21807.1 conserved hypothetical protein [Clostridium botulinum B str. Eklund 17B (NRP)]KFX54062.1 hypothetical protein KU40_16780 [Clostridium botulinum]MBN1045332.1 hypothetical protein [Clostridium botulinum]MBN1052090.1 hypothetical protein [Clostridium botulinum]MBN1055285.1 hypothetical protein [Clostridium botulinum]